MKGLEQRHTKPLWAGQPWFAFLCLPICAAAIASGYRSPAADGPLFQRQGVSGGLLQTLKQSEGNTSESFQFPEGRYLFGQVSEPEQIGFVYVVFIAKNDWLTGAFYMPRSSFDCFQGQVIDDRLSLTIRNSYDQTIFARSIPLVERREVIASQHSTTLGIALEGFEAISELSDNDHRILGICQSETW